EAMAGYQAGTWRIDPVHSLVSFTVRHMMIARFRGLFATFEGTIVLAEDPVDSSVTATVETASLQTRFGPRDENIRSDDFLDVERYPTMTYRSTGVQAWGEGWLVSGELTLHGVTRPVPLVLELHGFTADGRGPRVGLSATTEINRRDFGITKVLPLAAGGVMVGDQIWITLEVEAVRDPD
ncbi:MAG: YceI family protein, partial [Sporichthyaceae bacterium]|nr:YceI family protein [Sporichthyaceae bacterium]